MLLVHPLLAASGDTPAHRPPDLLHEPCVLPAPLKASLGEKGYQFRYDDALVDYLAEKSYSLTYGARNLRRLIQKELEDPIAAKIIDAFEHPITQIGATAKDGAVQLYTL